MLSLAPPLLPGLISQFVAAHAGIAFRTFEAHQDDLFAGLHDGSLDLALTYSIDLTDEIEFQPLISLPPYVILPKGHHIAQHRAVALSSLLGEPYVMLDLPHSREYFASLFDAVGERPAPAFKSAQPEVVRGMVANGLGYCILNFPLKSTQTVDGADFVVKRFKDDIAAVTLGIAQSRNMKPRNVVQRFAAFCEEQIRRQHVRR